MNESSPQSFSRLSRIDTLWSVVRRAHDGQGKIAATAQQQLLEVYGGAIRRYLLASLRDADVAEDMFQEFALKFVHGDFQNVDPSKGRFRSFVKTVLYRMVALHFRKKSTRKEQPLSIDSEEQVTGHIDQDEEDEKFLISWREDLLAQTWQSLADHESKTSVPYDSALRLRVAEPILDSKEYAERLSETIGKPMTSGSARVTLHRARTKFANLMIDIIANSLENPIRENIESELIELRLIDYCREALSRFGSGEND